MASGEPAGKILRFKKNEQLALAACILVGISMLLVMANPAQSRMSAWRIKAKQARKDLAEQRYDAAQRGYQSAMTMLQLEDAKADEAYDLTILLAESYRAEGNLTKSREVLDGIQKAIENGKSADPTLAIRFWRRRAEVEFSSGNNRKGLEYSRKILSLLEQHFPPSPALRSRLSPLLPIAAEELDLETFNYICELLSKEGWQTDKTLAIYLQGAYERLRNHVVVRVYKGDSSGAYRIVQSLANNDCFRDRKDELWYEYAKACFCTHRSADARLTMPILEEQAKRLEAKPESSANTRRLIELSHLMALIYEFSGSSSSKDTYEWQRVISLSAKLKPPHSVHDDLLLSRALNRIAMKEQQQPAKSLRLVLQSVKLTALDLARKDPDFLDLVETHLYSRGISANAYIALNDADKADAALSSISSSLLDAADKYGHRHFGLLYLSLAKLFLKNHRMDKAEASMGKGKKLINTLPPGTERTSALSQCQEVASEIAAKKRLPKEGVKSK